MDIVWQAEDSLREKKTEGDLKDILKTMVAFANSVAPGDTAQILIGEKDDGSVQGITDSDSIQKRVVKEAEKIYPESYYKTDVYQREGKQCLRVDIKHNGLAPHFGGPAWVRKGSQTIKATDELYRQMVQQRLSKDRELLKWLDKEVTVFWTQGRQQEFRDTLINLRYEQATLVALTAHWVTLSVHIATPQNNHVRRDTVDCSESIDKLMLNWDDVKRRLKVEVMI